MKRNDRSGLAVAIWAIVITVLGLGLIIGAKIYSNSHEKTTAARTTAPTSITDKLSGLESALAKVGEGSVNKLPSPIADGEKLTENDKPKVIAFGAEYCPYCAAERWALVVALNRFGTFTDLGLTSSSSTDAYPSTKTLSFYGASYKSDYLVFKGIEQYGNVAGATGQYEELTKLSSDEQAIITKYDAAPYVSASSAGSIPFLYLGGKYLNAGASYSPSVLTGKSYEEIASAINDTDSDISKGILGTANGLTAAICQLTDSQPESVCSTPAIKSIVSKLGQ